MKVEKLMVREVATCSPEDQASVAARIMWEHDCGTVPVVDDSSRVVGMITDRDLCMASYLEGKALGDIPVRHAMSQELWSCGPRDDLATAEQMMRLHRVRRLPVTDPNGRLKGILSLCDIAREATKEAGPRSKKSTEVSYTDIGQTLGEINAPHEELRAVRAS